MKGVVGDRQIGGRRPARDAPGGVEFRAVTGADPALAARPGVWHAAGVWTIALHNQPLGILCGNPFAVSLRSDQRAAVGAPGGGDLLRRAMVDQDQFALPDASDGLPGGDPRQRNVERRALSDGFFIRAKGGNQRPGIPGAAPECGLCYPPPLRAPLLLIDA
jgi:hypothetical protein